MKLIKNYQKFPADAPRSKTEQKLNSRMMEYVRGEFGKVQREYRARESGRTASEDARQDLVMLLWHAHSVTSPAFHFNEYIRLSRPASKIFEGANAETGYDYIDEIVANEKMSVGLRYFLLDLVSHQASKQLSKKDHEEVQAYLNALGWLSFKFNKTSKRPWNEVVEEYNFSSFRRLTTPATPTRKKPASLPPRLANDMVAAVRDLPAALMQKVVDWHQQETARLAKVIKDPEHIDPRVLELATYLAADPPDMEKTADWLKHLRKDMTPEMLAMLFSTAMGRGFTSAHTHASSARHENNHLLDSKLIELWDELDARGVSRGKAKAIIAAKLKAFAEKHGLKTRGLSEGTIENKLKSGALAKLRAAVAAREKS